MRHPEICRRLCSTRSRDRSCHTSRSDDALRRERGSGEGIGRRVGWLAREDLASGKLAGETHLHTTVIATAVAHGAVQLIVGHPAVILRW